MYDIIRLDHFKGFEKYYNVSAETRDPKSGVWKKGPGFEFWQTAAEQLGFNSVSDMPIFAEDLGIYTPELKKLVNDCNARKNYKNKYLPQNYEKPFVAYLGTHDTNTIIGYIDEALPEVRKNLENFYEETDPHKWLHIMMDDVVKSGANICILMVQDLLELAQDARINTPGTTGIN